MFFYDMIKNNRNMVLGTSAIISTIMLFYYIKNSKNTAIIIKSNKNNRYETKYYDAFELLENEELDEERLSNMKNNVLYENTPKGRVIMYYNKETESFHYYCDTKEISYLYLETVARKYALTYDCKYIVVDIKNEFKIAKDIKNGNYDKDENVVVKPKNDIYASFKNYNKKSGEIATGNKKYILRKNANRYSYKGRTSDFSVIKSSEYKSQKIEDILDYETFKRMMNKKN
jgi:hypothetical protein